MLMEANLVRELAEAGMQAEEISSNLHIDPVELDVMLSKSQDFISVAESAQILAGEKMEDLSLQGLTGDNARVVAGRHAIIDAGQVTKGQNNEQLRRETGSNVRVELTYAREQYEVLKKGMFLYDNAKDFIFNVCKWWSETHPEAQ
jgi:hypothetical protein